MEAYIPKWSNTKRHALSDKRVKGVNLSKLDKKRIYAIYEHRDRLNILESNSGGLNYWEIDHIRPVSQGGQHEPGNLRLLRKYANTPKFRTDEDIDGLRKIAIQHLFDDNWPDIDWQCPRCVW